MSLAITPTCSQVSGQQIFKPKSPQVRQLATTAANYLIANPPENTNELILAALAVTEYSKRYDKKTPQDNPLVKSAIGEILAGVRAPHTGKLLKYNGAYGPALACILLCEVNPKKYQEQITVLLRELASRQNKDGGFGYLADHKMVGDTSQMQYVALAFYTAHRKKFKVVNIDVATKSAEWLGENNLSSGSWWYQYRNGQPSIGPSGGPRNELTLSIHAAGTSTAYLYYHLFNGQSYSKTGRPETASYFRQVQNKLDVDEKVIADLSKTINKANRFFEKNFSIKTDKYEKWNHYYLAALERYAFFRGLYDDEFKKNSNWYDQGVLFLLNKKLRDGGLPPGSKTSESQAVTNSFAILFLVRSSEMNLSHVPRQ